MKSKENYSGVKGIFKFIANVVSWTALVILVLLALFLAYYTINTRLYASRGEKFEPFVSLYTIVSGSMEPNIKVWDVVISKKVKSPEEIKVGDVITFTSTSSISRGMIVTHRVMEVKKENDGYKYKTKGDNNLSPDSAYAEYNNVIGKVILRVPQLGRVQHFLGTQGGWLVVIVIPALFVIISDIMKIFKLSGVKNKIEKINENEKQGRLLRAEEEEKRKELLKERLKIEKTHEKVKPKESLRVKKSFSANESILGKNSNEPDPIVVRKIPNVVVASNKKELTSKDSLKNKQDKKNYSRKNVKRKPRNRR